ncbi:GIY-YIG nuclease family protein [Bradyrhizobium sp. AZCC 2230]|uniref:GIY-YIG nuclease family protein n=1 Tax=Bradyrhizobium sp. AZCC 2230 TaxID=3117021 RepID=UPI002FF1EED1
MGSLERCTNEAGFAPNQWQGKSETNIILQRYIEAARHYGHLPTASELAPHRKTNADFPSTKAIFKHFGSKNDLLSNLRTWVEDKPDLHDIAGMLGIETEKAVGRAAHEGLVYLIRSGAHYKIGRSDEIERRVKEIRVVQPEAASLVHAIRTDDPSGIEAYWHRRFSDRRANGEWFKLTAADVAAFKRRKFQ